MGVRTIGTDQITYHFGPDVAPVLEAEPGDTVVFETQTDDVSIGRYPDGAPDFDAHTTATPGTRNAAHAP